MSIFFEELDVDAELQSLETPPPKAPKAPKEKGKISHFSHFRWGQGENVNFPWPCRYCGNAATIEDVFSSLDGERTLTMWRCDPCQTVAVTPSTIKEPPSGWVKRTQQ